MTRSFTLAMLGVAIGCGPQVAIDDTAGESGTGGSGSAGDGATSIGSSTAGPSTSGPAPGTTLPPDPTVATSVSTSTGDGTGFDENGFIDDGFDDDGCGIGPDGSYRCVFECDVFAQDCPAGEKCMPWANDGGAHWNATRCSPLDPSPALVGEACHMEGSGVSGIDDCELGAMCLHVDPETGAGVCVAMCEGTANMPVCADDTQCMIRYDGAIALCVATCDPVASSCPIGDCIPIDTGKAGPVGFGCFVDTGDAAPGEPCERPGDCSSGATCNFGSPECPDVFGCCASYCDLDAPEPHAPCLPGQACTQIFGRDDAGPEVAHFGMCMAP